MTREEINNMNHKQFVEFLKRYADARDGELSYIANSASHRINVLNNRVDELEQEQKTDDDAISRQAVLDGIAEWVAGGYADSEADISHISSLVTHLPSVNPQEPKTGHWIDIDSETYTWKICCDQCGHERSMMSTQGKYPNFCEECGAKMKSEG